MAMTKEAAERMVNKLDAHVRAIQEIAKQLAEHDADLGRALRRAAVSVDDIAVEIFELPIFDDAPPAGEEQL